MKDEIMVLLYQLISMVKGQKLWLLLVLGLGALFFYGELHGIRLLGSTTTHSTRQQGATIHNGINHK